MENSSVANSINIYDYRIQKLRHEITLSSRAGERSSVYFNGSVKYPFTFENGYKPDPHNIKGVIVGLKCLSLPSATPASSSPDAVETIVVRLRNFNNGNSTWFNTEAGSVTGGGVTLNPHGVSPSGVLAIIGMPTGRPPPAGGALDWLYINTGDATQGGIYGQNPFNNIQIDLCGLNGDVLKIALTDNWICTLVVQFLVNDLDAVK
jgi:hypothetical protein